MKIEKISMTFFDWSNNFYISWSTFIPGQRQLQLRHYYADDCGVASSICCPPPQQGRGYARGKGEVARGGLRVRVLLLVGTLPPQLEVGS